MTLIKPGNWAENPERTLYTKCEHDFFTPHLHQTPDRADNSKRYSPTLPLHSYPPCAVQIHLVLGDIFFPVLLLQILLNEQTKLGLTRTEGGMAGHTGCRESSLNFQPTFLGLMEEESHFIGTVW